MENNETRTLSGLRRYFVAKYKQWVNTEKIEIASLWNAPLNDVNPEYVYGGFDTVMPIAVRFMDDFEVVQRFPVPKTEAQKKAIMRDFLKNYRRPATPLDAVVNEDEFYGFLSRKGEFYLCEHAGHSSLSNSLLIQYYPTLAAGNDKHSAEAILRRKGWIVARYRKLQMQVTMKPTRAQRVWLREIAGRNPNQHYRAQALAILNK